MPTTLEETNRSVAAESVVAESSAEKAEPKHDAQWYVDQDPALYPEAIAHVLTPRRRIVVTTETFAAVRAACDTH